LTKAVTSWGWMKIPTISPRAFRNGAVVMFQYRSAKTPGLPGTSMS